MIDNCEDTLAFMALFTAYKTAQGINRGAALFDLLVFTYQKQGVRALKQLVKNEIDNTQCDIVTALIMGHALKKKSIPAT